MSDTQQGPGWWQATDGKWYPPETHPTRQAATSGQPPVTGGQIPTPSYGVPPPGYVAPPTGPPYPTSPGSGPAAGYQAAGYQQWGSGYSPYGAAAGTPFAPPPRTNGLATASLACSVAGVLPFLFGVSCVVGIVLGFVALGQIKRTNGAQQGRGLAIAGISVGFALIAIFVLVVSLAVATAHNNQ